MQQFNVGDHVLVSIFDNGEQRGAVVEEVQQSTENDQEPEFYYRCRPCGPVETWPTIMQSHPEPDGTIWFNSTEVKPTVAPVNHDVSV